MIYFFRKLMGLCVHQWSVLDQASIMSVQGGYGINHWRKTGVKYTLQCKDCGNIKTVKSEV